MYRLLRGWVKIHKIPHVIYETTSKFFSELCITLQCHERQIFCTFLAETLYCFDERSPSKCQFLDFRFHESCTLIGSLLKVYEISAKKVQRSYVSWHWRLMQNLKKNWFVVLKMTRYWWILIRALKSVNNLHFD